MDSRLFMLYELELKGEEKYREIYSSERIDDAIKNKDNISLYRLNISYYIHNLNEIRDKRFKEFYFLTKESLTRDEITYFNRIMELSEFGLECEIPTTCEFYFPHTFEEEVDFTC